MWGLAWVPTPPVASCSPCTFSVQTKRPFGGCAHRAEWVGIFSYGEKDGGGRFAMVSYLDVGWRNN